MRSPIALALFLAAAAAAAQPAEDAAHRADRLRTEALNRRSPDGYAPGGRASRAERDYARASDAYRARLAAWRAQVAACQSGDDAACDPRR